MGKYCIKDGYVHRTEYRYFDDRSFKDEYQDKVYARIHEFCQREGLRRILDVGCGSGFKLMKYFSEFETLGLDVEPTLSFLMGKYPTRSWQLSDFSAPPQAEFDIAISIDVIEHLLDPDELMNFFGSIKAPYLALGTPDRDNLPPPGGVNGPPNNAHHIREWSAAEFREYVSGFFEIIESDVVSGCEHYVICRRR